MSGECFGKDVIGDDPNIVEENCSEHDKNNGDWGFEGREVKDIKLHDILPATNANKCRSLLRQNSGAIGTDNSGAAVVTINNILSGITNSINRLSELHGCFDIDKRSGKTSKKSQANDTNEYVSSKSGSMIDIKKKDKKRHKRRSITLLQSSSSLIETRNSSKSKCTKRDESYKRASTTSMKKGKVKRLQQLSKTSIVKKTPKSSVKLPGTNNNLVEIYHNNAAKSSESDEVLNSQPNCKKTNLTELGLSKHIESSISSSPIPGNDKKAELRCPSRRSEVQYLRTLTPIQEQQHLDVYESTNYGTDVSIFNHNYEAPTISSKMKQNQKGYYYHMGEKSIPFCAATSTSPSHNIGINIQQVMNIIKTKQPIQGISPTLAHNIGIAAERLNHSSLSALVSSFGSKIGYTNSRCPMTKTPMNYKELQELAKDVVEDVIEEVEEDGLEIETELINRNKNRQSVWTMDPNKQTNCTCVPKQGVGFQQILNRYQQTPNYQTPNTEYVQTVLKRSKLRYKHVKSVYAQYNDQSRGRRNSGEEQSNNNSAGEGSMNLRSKEKMLKGVLLNLHNEFQQLNERYDELSKSTNAGGDGEMHFSDVKELEHLERKLNNKEEEIEMVMTLYGEVINLKQQVKELREKASAGTGVVMLDNQKPQCQMIAHDSQSFQYQQPRRRSSQGAAIANLSKFLRQIKHLQGCAKM